MTNEHDEYSPNWKQDPWKDLYWNLAYILGTTVMMVCSSNPYNWEKSQNPEQMVLPSFFRFPPNQNTQFRAQLRFQTWNRVIKTSKPRFNTPSTPSPLHYLGPLGPQISTWLDFVFLFKHSYDPMIFPSVSPLPFTWGSWFMLLPLNWQLYHPKNNATRYFR